jgi:alpha-beta hydrolase superfamily lysophospholipase
MRWLILGLLGLLSLLPVGRAAAEVVTLTRADGASFAARLSGDWGRGCPPTLILSHGLGGDERALPWADAAAAAAGFRVLVMEHRESGPQVFRSLRAQGGADGVLVSPEVWEGRAGDLAAAVAFASRDCRPRPLVLGGHSMGAALTMAEAGARARFPYRGQDRFDAYVAVSPQGRSWAFGGAAPWAGVDKPVLMLTGTRDDGFDGTDWTARLAAFEGLPPGRKRLAVIAGANHFNLGGLGNRGAQRLAGQVTAEFLRMLQLGWTPTALGAASGLTIREK